MIRPHYIQSQGKLPSRSCLPSEVRLHRESGMGHMQVMWGKKGVVRGDKRVPQKRHRLAQWEVCLNIRKIPEYGAGHLIGPMVHMVSGLEITLIPRYARWLPLSLR